MMLPINNVDYSIDYSNNNLDYNNSNDNYSTTDTTTIGNNENNNNNNSDRNSVSNWVEKLSLSDISVGEILDIYKNDTDLLKHILAAKTEEDKRKGAEEIRRAEEARLHSKFIDLQLDQNRRSSSSTNTTMLEDNSLGLSNNDWLSTSNNTTRNNNNNNNNDLLSPFLNNTPPSPTSQLHQPLSPYTLFEVPFADLNLSAPSSPEPQNPPSLPLLVEKITLVDDNSSVITTATSATVTTTTANNNNSNSNNGSTQQQQQQQSTNNTLQVNNAPVEKQRASCKRTLSRTRSTRKPSIKALSKKNRSSMVQTKSTEEQIQELRQQQEAAEQQAQQQQAQVKEEAVPVPVPPLDHDKVMEALRAKLQRSTQQQKELKNNPREEITSMSPSGILLLDLKNPKKSFPVRQKATPRASVVRKPNSFISAHKPKD